MTIKNPKNRDEYMRSKYDRVYLSIDAGEKERWQEAARKAGLSLRAFIIGAVEAVIASTADTRRPPASEVTGGQLERSVLHEEQQ